MPVHAVHLVVARELVVRGGGSFAAARFKVRAARCRTGGRFRPIQIREVLQDRLYVDNALERDHFRPMLVPFI